MLMVVKVKKIGGSLMARIPIQAVKELNIRENDDIQLEVKKKKKSYFGALKGIGSFEEGDRFDTRL